MRSPLTLKYPLSIAPVGNGGSRLTGGSSQAPVTGPGKGAIRTRLYRDGVLIKENFPAEDISEQLQHKTGCLIWLDLSRPTASSSASLAVSLACTSWPSKMRSTKANARR